MAAVPAVVAEDELDRANGWLMATQFSGEELVGPAAGGIVFAVMPAAPFIADAASFVSSALLLRRLGPLFSVPTRRASGSLRRDMSEGVAFLRRSTTLRRLATLTSCYAGCQAMVGGVL